MRPDHTDLLSDYEDAVFAYARHQCLSAPTAEHDEREHLNTAMTLHAEVRRLRVEVLARLSG